MGHESIGLHISCDYRAPSFFKTIKVNMIGRISKQTQRELDRHIDKIREEFYQYMISLQQRLRKSSPVDQKTLPYDCLCALAVEDQEYALSLKRKDKTLSVKLTFHLHF